MENIQVLTERELEIMHIIWSNPEPWKAMPKSDILNDSRMLILKRYLQPIQVVLRRLEKKRVLSCVKFRNQNYYTPLIHKKEYLEFAVQHYLSHHYPDGRKVEKALGLLSDIGLTDTELVEFIEILNISKRRMILSHPIESELFEILYSDHPHSIFLVDESYYVLWSSRPYYSPITNLFKNRFRPYLKCVPFDEYATDEIDGFFCLVTPAFKDSTSYYKVEIVNLDSKDNAFNRKCLQDGCFDWAYAIYQRSPEELSSTIEGHFNIFLKYPQQAVEILRTMVIFNDYHCIREGNLSLNYTEVCIQDYFSWFANSMEQIAKSLNISFTYKHKHKTNLCIPMDTKILTKILTHLLSNIIRFGKIPIIEIDTEYDMHEFRITIQGGDSLPSRAFEAFYTSKSLGKRCGNGLGLTLASKMIDLLDGNLLIENSKGGTIYKLSIPFPSREKLSKHFYKVDLDKIFFLMMCDSFSIADKNTSFVLPKYKVI